MSIYSFALMSYCIVPFAYALSMFITAMLISPSNCPTVDLRNVFIQRLMGAKSPVVEHKVAEIVPLSKDCGHFDTWSLPAWLHFFFRMCS